MAIFNIIRFHKHLKSYMGENKPMQKLIAFKMVVGLEFLEQVRNIYTLLIRKCQNSNK
jgi:hypothetical protein